MQRFLFRTVLFFLFSLLLASCQLVDSTTNERCTFSSNEGIEDVTPITELRRTGNFQAGALAHILEGEVNRRGDAVGFHYDRLPTKKGEIIEGTKTEPNGLGVYEAKVEVEGIQKRSNRGMSTFFPNEWDSQEVVDAINEAYENRVFISGNTYEGLTEDGMIIRMYLNEVEKIISAFPIY